MANATNFLPSNSSGGGSRPSTTLNSSVNLIRCVALPHYSTTDNNIKSVGDIYFMGSSTTYGYMKKTDTGFQTIGGSQKAAATIPFTPTARRVTKTDDETQIIFNTASSNGSFTVFNVSDGGSPHQTINGLNTSNKIGQQLATSGEYLASSSTTDNQELQIYKRTAGTWASIFELATYVPYSVIDGLHMGNSGNDLFVSRSASNDGGVDRGLILHYTRTGDTFGGQTEIVPPNTYDNSRHQVVAFDGATLVTYQTLAPVGTVGFSDAEYIYHIWTNVEGTWTVQQSIPAHTPFIEFRTVVDGDDLFIHCSVCQVGADRGTGVLHYVRSGATWTLTNTLIGNQGSDFTSSPSAASNLDWNSSTRMLVSCGYAYNNTQNVGWLVP